MIPPWPSLAVTVTLPEAVVFSAAERANAKSLLSVVTVAEVIVTGLKGKLLFEASLGTLPMSVRIFIPDTTCPNTVYS